MADWAYREMQTQIHREKREFRSSEFSMEPRKQK
jgi:hypothetical protein